MKSTLMIKDLALDKQLDRKSMSAVRGGHANAYVGGNFQSVNGGGGFASPTIGGVQIGPVVTTTDASTHLDLKIPTMQNFGNGNQVLAAYGL